MYLISGKSLACIYNLFVFLLYLYLIAQYLVTGAFVPDVPKNVAPYLVQQSVLTLEK